MCIRDRAIDAAIEEASGYLGAYDRKKIFGTEGVSNTLGSVRRADAFRGESDMRFAQIACFLPVGKGKEESDILSFRQTLDTQLMEQSLGTKIWAGSN